MTRTLMKAGSAREKTFAASEATRTLPPASAVRSFDKDICKKPATRLALLVAVTFECRELIAPRDYADALEGTRPLSVTLHPTPFPLWTSVWRHLVHGVFLCFYKHEVSKQRDNSAVNWDSDAIHGKMLFWKRLRESSSALA